MFGMSMVLPDRPPSGASSGFPIGCRLRGAGLNRTLLPHLYFNRCRGWKILKGGLFTLGIHRNSAYGKRVVRRQKIAPRRRTGVVACVHFVRKREVKSGWGDAFSACVAPEEKRISRPEF